MMERLEQRRLLSAGPSASLSRGGTLSIIGTVNPDEIVVAKGSSAKYTSVYINGNPMLSVRTAAVKHLFIDAGPGDDDIDASALACGSTIYGSSGNDQIVGTAGPDLIYGEAGNDVLIGGYGNDTLYGGADNDTLDGGHNFDSLYGGDGVDTWKLSFGSDARGDAIENEDDQGQTVVHEDINPDSISVKIYRVGRRVTARVVLTLPNANYNVTIGPAQSSATAGVVKNIPIDVSLGLNGVLLPAFASYKAYFDLGELPAGKHTLTFSDASQAIVRSIAFNL